MASASKTRTIRRQKLKAHGPQPREGWVLILVLAMTGLGFVPHLTVVLLVGMMPSFVFYGVARGLARGLRCYTLAAFNLAGVLPYLFDMIWGPNQGAGAAMVLGDVYAWLVMYAAAALGAAVHWMAPGTAAYALTQRAREQAETLRRARDKLIAEWGPAVAGEGKGEGSSPTPADGARALVP
ncbi:MAG: hypothetical protein D6782_04720 [Alphaproteobacteria bacterium]|nr:MAG: hypothetical protein D6782_04720 [Alphaproteobacteria bacterium]